MNKTETCGFQLMCGADPSRDYVTTTTYIPEKRTSEGNPIVALILGGGILALFGAVIYLEATGKIKPAPVYYSPGYYPPYPPPPPRGPGVTFNF